MVLQRLKATRKILNFAQNTPLYIFALNSFCPSEKICQDVPLNSS